MKQIFNNEGVAQVQASIAGLPPAELAAEATSIKKATSIYKPKDRGAF